MRGRLIVIEGLDRSGKSTQCERLCSSLPNSYLQKFPDRSTEIGRLIDAYLRNASDVDDRCIHLLFSANRWELCSTILNTLNEGRHVILDRYIYSGITFSNIKGLPLDWCKACDVGLPSPDVILFLDVSEDIAALRGGFGDERYEKAETQRKVRAAFMELFQNSTEQVHFIDAGQSIESVEARIWDVIGVELKTEVGPVGRIV